MLLLLLCQKKYKLFITWFLMCIGWFYGDPHISTLDGKEYTFNGLGEYTLIVTDSAAFSLQGRTARALDDKNKEMQATVFSALAAQDSDSDRLHVQMNSARDGKKQMSLT